MDSLRERAKMWLDDYMTSNGDVVNLPSPEVIATVFAEYLRGGKDGDSYREKYDKCRAELEKEHARNSNLEQYIGKIAEAQRVTASTLDQYGKELANVKVELNNSELTRKSLASDLYEARGKIAAYEFAIRCNGVSGAEVH